MHVVGEEKVCLLVEFELIKLSSLVNVGGNLHDDQAKEIAEKLLEQYPNENIADFRACFHRGVMLRKYGEVVRLDAPTIAGWFAQYLEEKYEEHEKDIKRNKDTNIYETPRRLEFDTYDKFPAEGKPGLRYYDKEKGNHYEWVDGKYKPAFNIWEEFNKVHGSVTNKIPALTPEQIRREGGEHPMKRQWTGTPGTSMSDSEKWFRERYPNATDEQIQNLIYTGKL